MHTKIVVLVFAFAILLNWNTSAAASSISLEPDIAYVENAGPRQRLDLYLPDGVNEAPLVIFVHGGGWCMGNKAHPPVYLLLKRGFAVASINYRLVDQAIWPAQIHDVKAAIRYLRANAAKYNVDPNKFGIWGMSAGGHLAALAGTSGGISALEGQLGNTKISSRVQAVVDWYGPTDLTDSHGEAVRPNVRDMVTRFLGGTCKQKPQEYRAASPMTYCSSDDPPFLIMHGDRDELVPLRQSTALCDALKAARVPAQLVVVKNAGHILFPEEYLQMVADFFSKNLK